MGNSVFQICFYIICQKYDTVDILLAKLINANKHVLNNTNLNFKTKQEEINYIEYKKI